MSSFKQSELGVLVSVRIDPTSGRATRSRADAAAVALAQNALGEGREPWLCTAGGMPAGVARDYLAQGVSQITRLPVRADGSLEDVASVLEAACRERGPLLTGARGESGFGSGLLPYALAQRLHRPLINEVIDLVQEADGGWRVVQALPRGARRSWRLEPGVAAVLVTSARLAQREDLPQRYSWAAAQAGTIVEAAVAAAASRPSSNCRTAAPKTVARPLGGRAPYPATGGGHDRRVDWRFEPARKQRRPLMPVSVESGAARMARATGSAESAGPSGIVVRDGSVMDKARLLLEHLRKLSLVQPEA